MVFIARSSVSLTWLLGWECDNGILLLDGDEKFFITDSRYTQEAKERLEGIQIIEDRNLEKRLGSLLRTRHIRKAQLDTHEWHIGAFNALKNTTSCVLTPITDLWAKKRMIKTSEEIETIAQSVNIGRECFNELGLWLASHGNGLTERELYYKAKEILSARGTRELSFDPIIAIGENGAKPHARVSEKKLVENETLLVDAGVKYEGYCSDRTRTVNFSQKIHFGWEQTLATPLWQKIYNTVLKAHDKAIEGIHAGIKACEVDKLARDVIEEAGYGEYFIHSTGHGVGLEIHEYPYINKRSTTRIEEGMVFTIEPGIYIPGVIGVRIEDMVTIIQGKTVVL